MATKLKNQDIAAALNVHPSLISRYVRQNMPTTSIDAVLDWKKANIRPRIKPADTGEQSGLFDYDDARARREHFAAQREEVKFRQEAGELMEVVKVNNLLFEIGTLVRLGLEAFPGTLAPQLAGKDENHIFATLAKEVENVLWAISHTAEKMGEASKRARGEADELA